MALILRFLLCVLTSLVAVTIACSAESGQSRAQVFARAAALQALGQKIFFDASLSASGRSSCASCHSPDHAFGPPNALSVQLGGKDMKQPGLRAVPSLKYLQVVPQFTEHYYDSEDEGDASVDNGPTGGLTWDGRADRGRHQARVPLFSDFEMANESAAALASRVRRASYASDLRKLFGASVFNDNDKTVAAIAEALEVFEQDHRLFYPYDSKYDAYLDGKATLTPREERDSRCSTMRTKAIATLAIAASAMRRARRRSSPTTV